MKKHLARNLAIGFVSLAGLAYTFVVVSALNDKFNEWDAQSKVAPQEEAVLAPPQAPTYTYDRLLAETNLHRATPLTLDTVLNDTAQAKCVDMAARDDWSHGDVTGYPKKLGRIHFGENLAYGQSSEKEVVDEWVASPGHYENLVREEYNRVGFGMCPFRGGTLVVQHFSD